MPAERPAKPSDAFNKMSRVRQMGLSGLQASTIGWVFAGCILLGFLAGAWLDKRQGTTIWTPILVMVGVVSGFVQMFRTLKDINRAEAFAREQRQAERAANAQKQAQNTARNEASAPPTLAAADETGAAPPKRLFSVPAPPLPSYEGGNAPQTDESADGEDVEAVLAKLLKAQREDEDESQTSRKS